MRMYETVVGFMHKRTYKLQNSYVLSQQYICVTKLWQLIESVAGQEITHLLDHQGIFVSLC